MFSKTFQLHQEHLRHCFLKCRRYGSNFKPKKSYFSMSEGKLLKHIVTQDGIKIDPERVEAIQTIPFLRHKQEVQSFLGKITF
jgi:hypothetical protein